MKYLVDSNVLLEVALRRQYFADASEFLTRTPAADLAVADFSVHALGFYLTRKTPDVFDALVSDLVTRAIAIIRLDLGQLKMVTANAKQLGLDFDDAFVHTVAELHDLVIVSLDSHFDQTPRGRKSPGAVVHGK